MKELADRRGTKWKCETLWERKEERWNRRKPEPIYSNTDQDPFFHSWTREKTKRKPKLKTQRKKNWRRLDSSRKKGKRRETPYEWEWTTEPESVERKDERKMNESLRTSLNNLSLISLKDSIKHILWFPLLSSRAYEILNLFFDDIPYLFLGQAICWRTFLYRRVSKFIVFIRSNFRAA